MASGGRVLENRIVDLIFERGLEPGVPLPPEATLVSDLGAGRNSVREALRALHTQGIVDIRHGYGTFVGDAPLAAMAPGLLFRTRQSVGAGAKTLRELVQLRRWLETSIAAELAECPPDEEFLTRLDDAVDAMAAAQHDGLDDLLDADRHFHDLLYAPARNALAVQLVGLFWHVYGRTAGSLGPPLAAGESIVAAHRRIVDALRAGGRDEVVDAVRRHFDEVEERILRLDGEG